MVVKLVVRVQADLLPQFSDASGSVVSQVGLRLSVLADVPPGEILATPVKDVLKDLCPWHWLSFDPAVPGNWNPHDPASWRLFRLDATGPVEITSKLPTPAGVDPGPLPDFVSALDQTLQILVDEAGEAAVRLPPDDQPIENRTVFGMVESLTGLPHPVPAGMCVFSVVSVAEDLSAARIVAIPRFHPFKGGNFDIDQAVFGATDPESVVTADAIAVSPSPWAAAIQFQLRASLAQTAMTRAGNASRLLDLSNLSIGRSNDDGGIGDEDYAAHLPGRLAEAIDPGARLIGAFDAAVEALRGSADPNDQEAVAKLAEDVKLAIDGADSAVLAFLEAMTADLFLATARASEAFSSVAQARFGVMAGEREASGARSQAARDAGQAFLRMLDRDESQDFALRRMRFPLMSLARLAATAGLPTEDVAKATRQETALDSEAGFLQFVREQWLALDSPRPLVVGMPRHLAARKFTAPTLDLTMQYEAVLDAAMFAAPGPRFTLSLEAAGDTALLTAGTLAFRFERVDLATIAVSVNGGPAINIAAAADQPFNFALTLSADRSALDLAIDGNPSVVSAPAQDLTRAPFRIMLEAIVGAVADFQPEAPTPGYSQQAGALLSAQGTRADLSLAFAGPYLPGILAGRQDWDVYPWPPSTGGLALAIRDGVAALVPRLYAKLAKRAASPAWFSPLVNRTIEFALRDAVQLASSAVPSASLERITMDAPALVMRIDQFQDFGTEDAWRRVAGYGALLGRTTAAPDAGTSPDAWWSLNAAELKVVAPKSPANPMTLQIVDPVAIQIGEGGGVRQSLLSYNNRWLATGLASDTEQDSQGEQNARPRRPERLEPPPQANYRLPALSFGYSYWLIPYLIGHGGTLPLWLRDAPANPLVRRGVPGKPIPDKLDQVKADARTKTYLRTRPIGNPRLFDLSGKSTLPAVPDKVEPLAGELPIRPAPVTLDAGNSTFFFRDVSGQRGTIAWQLPAQGQLAGFRLLLGDVCEAGKAYQASRTAVPQLHLVLWGTNGNAMSPEPLWDRLLKDVVHDLRLSFLIGDGANLTLRIERQTTPADLSEDEGVFSVEVDQATVGDWRDMFVEISVPTGQPGAQFEPPVVVPIQRNSGDDLTIVDSITSGKPVVAPEASHRARLISVFDGIQKQRPPDLQVRRPGVEFGSYERWINAALIETSGGPEQSRGEVAKQLNAAYAIATAQPPSDGKARDVSFEDPAVTAFCFELVEIFPRNRRIGIEVTEAISGANVFAAGASAPTPANRRLAELEFHFAASAALQSLSQTRVKASLQVGRIYELRSYGVVASGKQAFSPFETLARLSGPVRSTLRRVSIGGKDYFLGSPHVATLEVATVELPDLYNLPDPYDDAKWSSDDRLIELVRPPQDRDDTARIYLPRGLVAPNQQRDEFYRRTRYAATASLHSQRWSWRGHPQAEIAALEPHDKLLNSTWAKSVAETAFTGRRDGDTGDLIVRRLEKEHIYGGRRNLSEPLPLARSTAMFTKALEWRAGLNLWRFGLSLTSRYAALFPRQMPDETLAHLKQGKPSAWAVQAVPDRPSSRTLARPGLALVLPLTEPLMAGGATPPLLALFNERVYANSNLADGIDVAVDVARHPFTIAEQRIELARLQQQEPNSEAIADLEHRLSQHIQSPTDALKHWQEFGPDPIRTAAAHDGSPILLRTDGPLGYTFDAETEAGRFDHAGLLISPVGQHHRPWSMIKLRFRRLEAPESLFGVKDQELSASDLVLPLSGHRFPPGGDGVDVDHEGLLVDIAELKRGDTTELAFDLGAAGDAKAAGGTPEHAVMVTLSREPDDETGRDKVMIAARTWLGEAGKTQVMVEPYERVDVRLFLSGRERPEGVEKWTPQGDVAIKLRIEDKLSGLDVLERLDRNRWLAVSSVPLSGRKEVAQEAVLAVTMRQSLSTGTVRARALPARLSPFTPSVWCQFSESMSVLTVETGLSASSQSRSATIGELQAQPSDDMSALKISLLPKPGGPVPPPLLSLTTSFDTDAKAQIDQVLLAVVTRYVTDAFARLRERPIAVVHLTDLENRPVRAAEGKPYEIPLRPDGGEAAWWGDEAAPIQRGKGGRVRFLRMLVPKRTEAGGFVDTPARRLSDLFSESLINSDDLNPADALGQILGVSQPLEWQ